MKNNIRKLIALAMAFAMLLSMSALAAKETASDAFRLPEVLKRESEAPADPEAPAESEAPAETQEPLTIIGKAYVVLANADSTLNVRAAASTDSDRLGALNHGDSVSIAGYEGDWTLIDFNGNRGYVKSSYLADEMPKAEPAETIQPESTESAKAESNDEIAVDQPIESPVPSTVGEADVRIKADGLSEIFITIPDGAPLKVLGVEGDWVKVEIDGQIGYIYKDSVQGVEFESPALPDDPEADDQTKVTIFSSRRSVMAPGETVYLTSKLEGFEGYDTILFQWQADRGNGFEDIAGATEDTYSFAADAETLNYDWRLIVMYG